MLKLLDLLITLGEGESVFRNYVTESTTRVLQIQNGNFNLACTVDTEKQPCCKDVAGM